MNRARLVCLLALMVVLASCTTTILRLPGGGLYVAVSGYPSVPATPPPVATSEPTPTQGEPVPSITPTWSTCEAGNYYVTVMVDSLAIRQLTVSNTDDPLSQKVLRRLKAGTVLEVDACLLETTPGGWLPVITLDDGLQGIVHSGYVRVGQNLQS